MFDKKLILEFIFEIVEWFCRNDIFIFFCDMYGVRAGLVYEVGKRVL